MRPLAPNQPALVLVLATALLGGPLRGEDPVDFNREVRPVLSDKCFKCHGPDAGARKAKLRLDLAAGARRVLDADRPETSELLLRISHPDPDERMPPPDSKLALSKEEIGTLRRWVVQGASYEQHWSFVPLRKVEVPRTGSSWPGNEIDAFILESLEREGLAPSAEASRERLIRRLSFDLLGLPPTIAEIDAFLADRSDEAYEKLVDRLLAREEFGERMAVDWLDVARYSDTYGYQVDRDRFVWPWRDWVIRAFRENMPHDEFITQQLAGDLLPDATDEQILATTFNRLHPQKVEGGSTPEEFRVEYVADRNHTFGTAFLGLALECARCHDHKYDPITQKEYYQLFAFFNNIDEAGLYSYFTPAVPTPTLLLTDDATKAEIADIRSRIRDAEGELSRVATARREAFDSWLARRPESPPEPLGRIARLDFEDYKGGANRSVAGRIGKAVKLTGDDGIGLKVGNFRRFEPFSVALWMQTPDVKERAVVFHRSRAWTDAGSRGYQLLIEDGKLSASLIHFWPGNAIRVRTLEAIPTSRWLHVVVTYDGSSRAGGLRIHLDGEPARCEIVRDHLYKNITGGGGDNVTIGQRFRDRGFTDGLVDEFQVYDRELSALEVADLHDGTSLGETLARPAAQLSEEERDRLREYYLSTVDPEYREKLAALRAVREERSRRVDGIREIMVMSELSRPRTTHVLRRGTYDAPLEAVRADTPAALPPFPRDQPHNRLGLARWLTSPTHPLSSRVAVNRFWQMLFGQGLVRSPEDFGSQGQPPTHPELLDWLAADFIEHGWNVKRLVKQIVMSATYRQRSELTPELLARDPRNLLLARAPRYRLSAEMIRDNALAVSGLLVKKTGGSPARPYELAVSFKPVKQDRGEGLYRRSLYTYWKRTGPAPAMMVLDASKRDVCAVKRERTASPMQAFVLFNAPQFVEAARVLGEKLLKKHGDDLDALIVELFRTLTGRAPEKSEKEILGKLHEDQLAYFREDPARADEFLKTGDAPHDSGIPAERLAAAGVLVNTLMSFDEAIVKR